MPVFKQSKTIHNLLVLALFTAVTDVQATPPLILNDPTPTGADNFGASVAISGNRALVGAPLDDTLRKDVGQVSLFDTTTGALLRTFDSPSPTLFDRDHFGTSVAISGNNIVIGAPGDDTNGVSVGQAHLFDATTGGYLNTFNDPTPTLADNFGSVVAIDGDYVLIGAHLDDSIHTDAGQAYLFSASTGALLQTFDNPSPSDGDHFGISLAIDGDNVLIGAPEDDTIKKNTGQAYLFSASTGTLLQTFNNPTPMQGDNFGTSVDIDGDNVLIGAPLVNGSEVNTGKAYLFSTTSGLLQTFNGPTTGSGYFGTSVAISGDNILVGAPFDSTLGSFTGEVNLFSAATGVRLETFNDPMPTISDTFGGAVAIDGNTILVGARFDDTLGPNIGQAFIVSAVPLPAALPLYLSGLGLVVLVGMGEWGQTRTSY